MACSVMWFKRIRTWRFVLKQPAGTQAAGLYSEYIMTSVKTSFALSKTAAALCTIFLPAFVDAQTTAPAPDGAAQAVASAPAVLVTATRQVQAASDVLADHVIISADDIAKSGASTIVDLLQQQRGIEVARNGGSGTLASVFIRGGANVQNVVLVDGVRIGSSTTGGVNWSTIPLSQIDHIEIVYGPLSSLYGADALGGVVQVFTKKGGQTLSGQVGVGVGSFGLRKVDVGLAGPLSETLRFSLRAGHEKANGFNATKPDNFSFNPDKDGHQQDNLSADLVWQASRGVELGANVLYNRLKSQFDAGSFFDDHGRQRLQTEAVYGKFQLTDQWSSRLQVAQSLDKGFSDGFYGSSIDDPFAFHDVSRFKTKQDIVSWQNDVRLGTDSLQVFAESREEKVTTSTEGLDGKRITNSLAASYVLKQDAHLLSASARYDHSTQYGGKTTGSVAYGYRLSSSLRVNASVGSSFRAPTFNELYFPGFGIASNQPERGRNVEAGIYFDDGALQWSAVAFHNKVKDLIVSTDVCPIEQDTHPFGCAYNVNQATLQGVTLGAAYQWQHWKLRASLDLQNPVDDTTDKRLVRRARQHGSVALEYGLAQYHVGVETVFSGKRFDDAANLSQLGGYGLVNWYAQIGITPSLSFTARWNNVFNRDYELARTYATAKSNVFAGLNYTY